MRLIARSTIIASALAIVATAAPAASARPNLDPFTPGLSQSANSRPEVHANADHQGPQTDAVGIPPSLPRATAPERAANRQARQQEARWLAYKQPKNAKYSNDANNGYANDIAASVVHVVSRNGRFDWGDAGIGAAGALGLAILGAGGAFAVSQQRRARRSKASAPITS